MKKVVEVNKILILIGFILISLASVSANSGIWISNSELATLPASGTAWLNMKNEADQSSCIPALSNQDDNCNVRVLAQALVFAKLRQETYRTKVVSALTSIVNSGTYNGRSLALGRELGAYVISADLVDLNSFNPTLDTQFRNKIRELLTTPTSGGPVNIEDCHEKRPNNWGTMCGGSRAAVAAYLNDDAKLDRVAQVFKGYLGDRSSYVSFSYGDLSWQCNPSQPVGINPIGCIKEGHSIDGVMPDDQRRCGSFSWPPCNTGYAWEGQQGILFEAIILSRQGYDVWNWEDRAILRAHAWKVNVGNNQAGGDDTWQPWVVNYYYNTNFPAPSPSNPGKNIGWTDWTHQGNAQPLQSCSQQNGLCCGAGFTCSGNAIPSSDCNTICCLGSCQTPPQDTTPPTVSVNHNPTTNIQTTTSVNIIATATDQSGISNIEIFVDGSSRRTCTSSPCSYSSTYNAGSHSYYATARDIPGNQGRDPLTGSKSFNVANPTICTLSTASWSATGPLEEGTQVQLIVNMDQSCNSQQVSFEVREDDEIVGSNFNNADPTGIVIPNAIINNGIATINWNTIWIQDIGGIDEDPEYIFRATLVNNPAQTSDSINELKVNQDATPPTISNIQSNPAVTTATITWTTDDSSSSIVEYGTSSGTYTSTTTGNSGNIHNVLLGNLQMDTNYYFIVRSINNRGFSSQSTERTFRTLVGDVTEQNLRVAFIGDQGLGSNPIAVLNLIRNEGADMVIHAGDFDYQNNPTSFDNQITQVLGANFPYFGTVGNHDTSQWGGSLGYQRKLLDRLARVPGAICTGDYGVKSSCHYKGLFFILSGVGLTGGTSTEHGNYIRDQLAQDNSVWSVCAWHVLMKNMQIGGKGDESGWAPYEECRKAGAIVDTAHEHSYERTLTLTSMQNQIVDTVQHPLVNGIPSNPNNLLVALDRSFVFVSGLGGSSIRSQSRCLPSVYPYSSGAGCNYIWAKIYTSTQQAKYGATFIDFYVDNDPTKARGYFKNINGDVVDTFEIKSRAVGGGPNLPICGNNIIEGTEQCDGSNLNSQTCQSLGFTEGTLRCSSMCTFDTSSCTSTDTIPPIISDVQSTTITSNSATITWTTNEPSDSQIEYGLTTSYGSQTTSNSNLVTSHSQTITGLTASTLYHYRVKSRDISNNLAISGDFTFTTTAISTGTVSVLPTVETGGAHHSGDNADDSLIWLHPSDTSQSVVIGDDKGGGIMVWDLNGAEIQYLESSSLMNNLDLRYNFPLVGAYSNGGTHTSVALVGINNENGNKINFYKVNPSTRMLEPVGSIMLSTNAPYGSCMYHSPITGKYYYFVNWKSGAVQQWEIRDNNGQITGTMVRTFDVGTQVEGCVADDILGKFYIGEESTGVWKYGAEPIDGSSRVQVDRTSNGGHLTADVEGMSIYYTSQGTGYLLVSSQGNSIIAVYTKEGNNNYLGSFRIVANGAIDAVSGSDGIDVTNFPLGNSFSKGIFVVHDASNTGGSASNHKYVPWEEISNKLGLTIDTSWDPRLVGSEQEPGSICGNGICESGESFQNCPADCQTPPQDTTPPTVSVNHNPTTNIQTTTSVNIIATATDQSGISNIEIFVDGSSRRTCTSSPCSYSSTYNAGSHSYYATARDIPGNQGRDPLTGSKSFNVISGTCTTGQWQNQGCGEGSCTSSQMYQTRTVNPNGCAVTDQCVSDPSCTTSPVCGNNIREGTEQCDGSDLASQTCQSLGFSSGTLSCSASCTFNTNSCTGAISPIIIWDPPTPADGASINQNSVSLSTTITDNTNTAALFDWDNSLIGYWPMDTYTTLGINDKSTHNNFASFAGSLNTNSLASNGKFGKAFTFGGSSDFLKITDSNEFEGMDELTISAWINPTSGQSDQRIIFKSNTYMLRLNSGKISFRIYNAGSSADVNTLSTISLGTWSHIVTTFDGNTMKVYINGVQESTTNTISGPIRNVISSGGIAIGNNHAGGAAFNGLIDEVVILRRALSLEEIKALYDNGANRLSHSFTGLSERTYNYGAYAIDSEGNLNINRRSVIINFQQQCTTGQWQNQGCGEGSCTSSQMYQTRTVNPNGCAVTDQCVSDPSCTTSPVCGNNIREGTEQCDGSDLASQTCQSLGFSSGTLSCSASCTFNTNSCTTGDFSQLTYNLNSGYNFISVPFELQNNNINVLFSSILPQISRIYTYDPTGWGIFRANPNAPSSLTTISTLRGYIIKMKGPASVTLQGTVNNNVQKQLIQGWNLIGITGMNTITVQSALQNLDYDSIWKYDHINNEYTQMNASDLIQPGVGYWIYLNNPGIFNP